MTFVTFFKREVQNSLTCRWENWPGGLMAKTKNPGY